MRTIGKIGAGVAALVLAACGGTAGDEPVEAAPGDIARGVTQTVGPPACGLAAERIGAIADVPAGMLEKGRYAYYPEERADGSIHIAPFRIQIHEVTNGQFAAFVAATGYVTEAERTSASGDPGGGSAVFTQETGGALPDAWRLVRGATWKTPTGPGSDIAGRDTHPVVHVSLKDAEAYADWAGGRLPTEEEWEHAAQQGLRDPVDPSSGAMDADGRPSANTWQGLFPFQNAGSDGFTGAAPAGCFSADRLGLYDMIGNVWEWTRTPYAPGAHTIKGGSFLCAENFCRRYRPAARQPQESDFSSSHIGFRVVFDADSVGR